MEEDILERAAAYAASFAKLIIGRLGFGIHGTVFALKGNDDRGVSALKVHNSEAAYVRERDVYRALAQESITRICGFVVPTMLNCEDALMALEMTVVKPPFVLDFAGAWLHWPPSFSEDIWQEREEKWAEEFGDNWPKAQEILAGLEEFRIYMLDPSPSNIRFR